MHNKAASSADSPSIQEHATVVLCEIARAYSAVYAVGDHLEITRAQRALCIAATAYAKAAQAKRERQR
jgi:hypothetical protein